MKKYPQGQDQSPKYPLHHLEEIYLLTFQAQALSFVGLARLVHAPKMKKATVGPSSPSKTAHLLTIVSRYSRPRPATR